jgi:cysteine synthase A
MDPKAAQFVDEVIADPQQPVVIFALEWCEFCWSVRKLFKKLDIPYRSVDLDSVEFQEDQLGQKIRAVLLEKTTFKTIPQIFIGGEFVGGCTDLFDAWQDGSAQALLAKSNVAYAGDLTVDPYGFLPDWLHPR